MIGLLLADGLGRRIASPMFDRERLITGAGDEVVVTRGRAREPHRPTRRRTMTA
jgi:hypothetical protein